MTTRPSARVTLLLLATAAAAGSLECGGIAIVEPPRGDAGAACTAGLGDCDQSPSNGCETDLTSDAQHCGACGHGCQGGHCQSARCQAIVLAQGQAAAYRLAVDETHVYWTLGAKGIIARVPITGGQPETFASSQNGPADVAVQGGQVYWVNAGDGTVQRAPAAGGATTQIAAGQGQAWSIAVVAGTVIWNDEQSGAVRKLGPGDAAPTTLSTAPGSWAVAADEHRAYWTQLGPGDVLFAPLAGGAPVTLASNLGGPQAIAVSGDSVFFTLNGAGSVESVPRLGGVVTILSSEGGDALAVDSDNVYFGAHDGRLLRVPRAGGSATTLALGTAPATSIALDATSVYWTAADTSGLISRVAK